MFGVYDKKKGFIYMLAVREEEFNSKVKKAYQSARDMTAKGEEYTMADFMAGKEKLKLDVTVIK